METNLGFWGNLGSLESSSVGSQRSLEVSSLSDGGAVLSDDCRGRTVQWGCVGGWPQARHPCGHTPVGLVSHCPPRGPTVADGPPAPVDWKPQHFPANRRRLPANRRRLTANRLWPLAVTTNRLVTASASRAPWRPVVLVPGVREVPPNPKGSETSRGQSAHLANGAPAERIQTASTPPRRRDSSKTGTTAPVGPGDQHADTVSATCHD